MFDAASCGRRLHWRREIEKVLSLHWCNLLRNLQTAVASVNEPLEHFSNWKYWPKGLARNTLNEWIASDHNNNIHRSSSYQNAPILTSCRRPKLAQFRVWTNYGFRERFLSDFRVNKRLGFEFCLHACTWTHGSWPDMGPNEVANPVKIILHSCSNRFNQSECLNRA